MCVSTLAILRREAGSTSLALRLFAAYGIGAYALAMLAYQLTDLLLGG